jgi:retinol dehydrogenase-12
LVTGGASGLGFEFTKLLHSKNAKVWIAGRSQAKAENAIEAIEAANPNSQGGIEFTELDLSDLHTIKPGIDEFLQHETRLDLLVNNAGVMAINGETSKQGYELQWATNVLGHHYVTKLLVPILQETSKKAPEASVRVIWVSSGSASLQSPENDGGILWEDINFERVSSGFGNYLAYGQSKAGNLYQAAEFARRYADSGILSVSLHPGGLDTELLRNDSPILRWIYRVCLIWYAYYVG